MVGRARTAGYVSGLRSLTKRSAGMGAAVRENAKGKTANVDCDAGRRLGCHTFCCHLIVRLDPEERQLSTNGLAQKSCVDKDEHGRCIHMDPQSCRCHIWKDRPRVCREYDCNADHLLQVAVREGFTSVAQLVRRSAHIHIPKEMFISVPAAADE